MSKEIKGIKIEETESGSKILIDNSFEGPATLKKDIGLGFAEPCIEVVREGRNVFFKDASARKYLGKGFSLMVKCQCGETLEVKPTCTKDKCWGVCKCGAIFINPFYVDPVSESWQHSADKGEFYM